MELTPEMKALYDALDAESAKVADLAIQLIEELIEDVEAYLTAVAMGDHVTAHEKEEELQEALTAMKAAMTKTGTQVFSMLCQTVEAILSAGRMGIRSV